MIHRTRSTVSAALILLMSACSTRGSDTIPMPREYTDTRVEVTNNNWSAMRVYAVRGTSRFRLGTVTSMDTQVFRLPRAFSGASGEIRLIADPIGSHEMHVTPNINVAPGQMLSFQIENYLPISSLFIR
ncbi:hypothetical protein BH23GEM6_BH23GEM6_03600 [soil metagenome]